jgi:hypothetical protein
MERINTCLTTAIPGKKCLNLFAGQAKINDHQTGAGSGVFQRFNKSDKFVFKRKKEKK